MITKEILAQLEIIIKDVAAHGYGEIRITIQDGSIILVKPEYSYKFPHLTEIPNVSIIEITQ